MVRMGEIETCNRSAIFDQIRQTVDGVYFHKLYNCTNVERDLAYMHRAMTLGREIL